MYFLPALTWSLPSPSAMLQNIHTERNLRKPSNCFSAALKNRGDMKDGKSEFSLTTFWAPQLNWDTQVYSQNYFGAFMSHTSFSWADWGQSQPCSCCYPVWEPVTCSWRAAIASERCFHLKSFQLPLSSLLEGRKKLISLLTVRLKRALSDNLSHVWNDLQSSIFPFTSISITLRGFHYLWAAPSGALNYQQWRISNKATVNASAGNGRKMQKMHLLENGNSYSSHNVVGIWLPLVTEIWLNIQLASK